MSIPPVSAALLRKSFPLEQPSQSSSGTASPIPPDAPPSTHATSSVRKHVRAQVRSRRFPTIQYSARVSPLDPTAEYTDFSGFFVLFWIALGIMVITSMLRHLKDTGYPFEVSQLQLFRENIIELGPIDLAMVVSSASVLPLHRLFMSSSGAFKWSKGGMPLQALFEAIWLGFWVGWPFLRRWTWTAQVFFTLHVLTIFMKVHSYAFYNGHLAETRLQLLALDSAMSTDSEAFKNSEHAELLGRNKRSDDHLSPAEELSQVREALAFELTSPLGNVTYPDNLSIRNYADFVCCPTLCYELEYPRTEKTNWLRVGVQVLAVFGCIFLLIVISEDFVIPVLAESSAALLARGESTAEILLIFAETISRLLFPFMVSWLLVFLVIFEYVLGGFAELTRFADREFYAAWWNSRDWLEFSRTWNKPVHHFLSRHVYSASRANMSRASATTMTFFVSALAHELVMACITKKLRGYGIVAMMLQMPIVLVQRSKWVRGRTLLNNVLFWSSIITGLAVICSLYVLF